MQYCDSCGSAMVKVDEQWICRECNPNEVPDEPSRSARTPTPRSAEVAELPMTGSGAVRKSDAMDWLESLDAPTDQELKHAFLAKPSDFSGSTYPTSISNVRITGDPKFVQTVAGLFNLITDLEDSNTRVEINLQQTEDRETGEMTGNYALYLSIAERG